MLVLIVGTRTFDLNCDLRIQIWASAGSTMTCFASALNITSSEEIVTSINSETALGSEVFGFYAYNQQVNYFPLAIERFRPNLAAIFIRSSKLLHIRQSDLKPFGNLQLLHLPYNDIEFLPDNLFVYNTKLKIISFSGNSRLKVVGENLIPIGAEQAYFKNAGCINSFANHQDQLSSLQMKIRQSCLTAEKIELQQKALKIDALEMETSSLETKLLEINFKNEELKSKLAEIIIDKESTDEKIVTLALELITTDSELTLCNKNLSILQNYFIENKQYNVKFAEEN